MADLPRVLFVTSGLAVGGAEMMLLKLLSRLHNLHLDASVISLTSAGAVSEKLRLLKVPVLHLELNRPWRLPLAVGVFIRAVRAFRPQVIQGWMYHGNLLACLARMLAPGHPVLIWGVRQSLYDLEREKPTTRMVIRLGRWLSGCADFIIYNSEMSRRQHGDYGYERSGSRLIDNGFDTALFKPDPVARESVRNELAVPRQTPVIGFIARYHPMKGHEVFFQAASILAVKRPDLHFLLAGRNVDRLNPLFADWLQVAGAGGRIHLLGERQDIPRLAAALDIATSASLGEAFPNTIGEAMSCAVPCVATDVGDCRRIIGDTGRVVPPGDASALAEAWDDLLSLSQQALLALGEAARLRVAETFSLEEIAQRYSDLIQDVRKHG